MHEQNWMIIVSLLSVIWSDERFAGREREIVENLLAEFESSEEHAQEIRFQAAKRRTLDDIPLGDLNDDDRRVLLYHAVRLTFIDGEQNEDEKKLIRELAKKLDFEEPQASEMIGGAEKFAKRSLNIQ